MGTVCSRITIDTHNNSSAFPRIAHRKTSHLLTQTPLNRIAIPSRNLRLDYSVFSHKGFYSGRRNRAQNEDSFCIKTHLQDNPDLHFFAIFDGHGEFGEDCSSFASRRLLEILAADPTLFDDPSKGLKSAILGTNWDLRESGIDDRLSGTTAICVLVRGESLIVANLGDSRAVVGIRIGGGFVIAEEISRDHKPYREDELVRLKGCGAIVMSWGGIVRLAKNSEESIDEDEDEDEDDPPRVWVDAEKGLFGLAMSRSIGDGVAEKCGVIAEAEISTVEIKRDCHRFFVMGSDGVFDFLSSQDVVNMVGRFTDPRDACGQVAGESYKLWLERSNRTDDITIIVVYINDLNICS